MDVLTVVTVMGFVLRLVDLSRHVCDAKEECLSVVRIDLGQDDIMFMTRSLL